MAATDRLFDDFISFALDADPGSGGGSISAPGLADLRLIQANDFIALVLDPKAVFGDPEIVWVTDHSISSTGASVLRGQEGTSNRAHPIGTVGIAGLTQDAMDHATRHQPDAEDGLFTAAPVPIFADDPQEIGTSNALSRADHQHQIVTQTPNSIGNTNTEGAASAFARANHIHEITNAITVCVFGGSAESDNLQNTGTVFADYITDEFVMPPGWTWALIVLNGSVGFRGNGVGNDARVRASIGLDLGLEMARTDVGTSVVSLHMGHDAVATGDVTLALEIRGINQDSGGIDARNGAFTWTAMRAL